MRKSSISRWIFLLINIPLLIIFMTGCSTDPHLYEKIEAHIEPKAQELPITKGDNIFIYKNDGNLIKLTVTSIDSINIQGKRFINFGENPIAEYEIVNLADISIIKKVQLIEKQGDTTEDLILGGITGFMYVATAIYGLAYILGAL